MLFNSFEFLILLPVVFLIYWLVFKKRNVQNVFILVVSYVFYGWWDWRFLILIAFTSLFSFLSGVFIEKYKSHERTKKYILVVNVIINLLILGIFKYYNFFTENLEILFSKFGFELDWITLKILLPVGISFYMTPILMDYIMTLTGFKASEVKRYKLC